MPSIVPSYIAKVARAEKHLVELEDAIEKWAGPHPYRAVKRLEGKKKQPIFRLAFTADPANTDISVIAADVIYNLRSALDHLMSCLVPSNQRSSAIFPIYFQGVWEVSPPGEDQQRIKARARWASDTKALKPEPLAILKNLQPSEGAGNPNELHLFQLVNTLSNRDRHEKLPVIAAGIRDIQVRFSRADGSRHQGLGIIEFGDMLENNAPMTNIPHDAMNVQVEGIPKVAINIGDQQRRVRRYVLVPDVLREAKHAIDQRAIRPLTPFVRR